eukprot:scaffold2134_cov384-Prasinococcus_capsulatus_cf.AAC.18
MPDGLLCCRHVLPQFVADGVFYAELNEYLTRELSEDGYAGVEAPCTKQAALLANWLVVQVRVTPMRTEIIIRATRTQNVLGEKGRRIRELTSLVQKRFKFAEGAVELYAEKVGIAPGCIMRRVRPDALRSPHAALVRKVTDIVRAALLQVANRGLCAIAQCESLRYKLLGGLAVRRACYGILRFVMESGSYPLRPAGQTGVAALLSRCACSLGVRALSVASGLRSTATGAKGCEVTVSGKIRGARAKAMKFKDGYMISSGSPVREYIDTSVRYVLLRQGMLGLKVRRRAVLVT